MKIRPKLKSWSKVDWIEAIEAGEKEQDNVLYQDQHVLAVYDYKYNWKVDPTGKLYVLLIFKDKNLLTIRDLREEHVKMLEQTRDKIYKKLKELHDVDQNTLNLFFHYPPSFQRLHLHLIKIENNSQDTKTDRAHLLNRVINNLKIDGDYYKKSSITIKYKGTLEDFYK